MIGRDNRVMAHVCPVWQAYFIDNFVRRWLHQPRRLFGQYVTPGMTVVDLGCGLGFATLALATLVGPTGRVIAVDIQPGMLAALMRRADKAGLADRIHPHLATTSGLGLGEKADFAVAFWMVHEAPEPARLLAEVAASLNANGRFLLVEPQLHVSRQAFEHTVALACNTGFSLLANPRILISRAALLDMSTEPG
ncbi:MAG: methyltransferase domain-containing protein [Pseudomonadota bacterium]